MPSENDIKEWKEKYGKIYSVNISNQRYIYRSLNVGEVEKIQQFHREGNYLDSEEYVIESALLYPSEIDYESTLAGVISTLSESIVSSAGVLTNKGFNNVLYKSREWIQSREENDFFIWKVRIMQTFPGYKLSDLDAMNPLEFFKLIRLCEKMTNQSFIEESHPVNTRQVKNNSNDSYPNKSGSSLLSSNDFRVVAAQDAARKLSEEYKKHKKEA